MNHASDDPPHPERLARSLALGLGSTWAFRIAVAFVCAWLLVGPVVVDWDSGYKVMEQVANSVMFLMLFLLQRTQNKDTMALQLKLNELVAANPAASNRVLNAEDIPESELRRIRTHFRVLDELSRGAGIDPLDVAAAHRRHAEEQRLLARAAGMDDAPRD